MVRYYAIIIKFDGGHIILTLSTCHLPFHTIGRALQTSLYKTGIMKCIYKEDDEFENLPYDPRRNS